MPLERLRQYFDGVKASISPEPDKLRFINWYLSHGCNLSCDFCRVPRHPTTIMNFGERQEALGKLQQVSSPGALLSIFGGEPTANPALLTEAVRDAADAGYFVCLATNGWKLSPDLVEELGNAGLKYLSLSVDHEHGRDQKHIEESFQLLTIAREHGIVPVVNSVLTKQTGVKKFEQFIDTVLQAGLFVNPIACSPEVPDGTFSNASIDSVPTPEQLKEFIPWLAWQKLKTGRVTSTFNYLKILFDISEQSDEGANLWHCSPYFRQRDRTLGRGFLTLDSDGYIGPCQEYPRVINLLDVPSAQLTLHAIDSQLSEVTQKCPGCLYNCYFMEQETSGFTTIAEVQKGIQVGNILRRRR
jgi:MoaA/NifB/PqqE/SkfB family radical SAM enzyme